MESPLKARGRFERASFIRHLAICVAAVVAYVLRAQVHFGNEALWIIGITAVANALITLVPDRPSWTRFSLLASPCFGLAGWTILVYVTGGVSSLFIAGFWLEIVLSAWTCSSTGTLVVTAGAVAALWTQQFLFGGSAPIKSLALQTGFLTAMGGITLLLTRQWARTQSEAARRHAALVNHLRTLESEMEVLRAVGEVGANVGLLAHALKNAVHSLRGFAALIDTRIGGPDGHAQAFEGLRAAIDRLEDMARVTLGGGAGGAVLMKGSETRRVIDEAIDEVSVSHPRIDWLRTIDEPLPSIHADRAMLREALLNVTRNAAEAMNGCGEIAVETVVDADRFEIRIRDHGSGLTDEDLRRTVKPGFTTKPGGSGFGLYLTRRLVESFGGRLTVSPGRERGTVLSVGLLRGNGERP